MAIVHLVATATSCAASSSATRSGLMLCDAGAVIGLAATLSD